MTNQEYHNKKWGVEDFERYHSGDMPELEMHALEKAALDDPFLEDALEGYAYAKTPVKDLEELRRKLSPAKERTRVIWYKQKGTSQVLKIAALLLLFLGFAWLLNNNMEENKTEIASVSKTEILPDTIATDAGTQGIAETNATVLEEEKKEENPRTQPVVPLNKQRPGKESASTELISPAPASAVADSQAVKDIDAKETLQFRSKEKAEATAAIVNPSLQNEVKIRGLASPGNEKKNEFRGRVVDDAGRPVSFASINDRNNNVALAADKDGYFALDNRLNLSNVKVDVNAVGFESANVALNADQSENKIVLKENSQQLSEVVIGGYAPKKKRAVLSARKFENDLSKEYNNKMILVNAIPVEGWENFQRFIKDSADNKKLPAAGYREVVLSFTIDSFGRAQNIVVKKSISDSADAAAKQLLRSIPAIKKIKKDKNTEALIRF